MLKALTPVHHKIATIVQLICYTVVDRQDPNIGELELATVVFPDQSLCFFRTWLTQLAL